MAERSGPKNVTLPMAVFINWSKGGVRQCKIPAAMPERAAMGRNTYQYRASNF